MFSRGDFLLMDNYTLAVLRSQGGRVREVWYENNNYRIQVWNVEIRREEGGERGEGAHLVSQAGEVGVQHSALL